MQGLPKEPNRDEYPHERDHKAYPGERANREVERGSDKDYGGLQHIAQSNAKRFDSGVRLVLGLARSGQQKRLPHSVLQGVVRGILANLKDAHNAQHGIDDYRQKRGQRKRWENEQGSAYSDAFEDTGDQESLSQKSEKIDPPIVVRVEGTDVGFSRRHSRGRSADDVVRMSQQQFPKNKVARADDDVEQDGEKGNQTQVGIRKDQLKSPSRAEGFGILLFLRFACPVRDHASGQTRHQRTDTQGDRGDEHHIVRTNRPHQL